MSQLTELIEKTIHDIQFNGCTLPESIIRMQIDNIVACAKLEESRERNAAYLESFKLDSAHGNGGNDRPNIDNHKGFIVGEVYKNNDTDALCYYSGINPNGYFVFEHISFTGAKDIPLPDNFISKGNNTFWSYEGIEKEFNPTPYKTPNVIGDMITEPSLTPEQLVKGEWYVTFLTNDNYWLFEFDSIKNGYVYTNKTVYLGNSRYFNLYGTLSFVKDFKSIRHATKEEVLKYFPDETFTEPADYVNPITN